MNDTYNCRIGSKNHEIKMESRKLPARKDGRVIIHFDYDCFYASVFEAKNPSLRSLPFAVQQKHIIVTCNYEARRRGLHKLQLITEAKRVCPDVIIALGEDISQFRDASKELYNFISAYSWSGKIERLGFDEVWMDVTDMIDYNVEVLNRIDLQHSFFQTSRDDPTQGFEFDASSVAGHLYPKEMPSDAKIDNGSEDLNLRLRLGSHLALYIRHQLESQKGYTSTVGIATNKLLSKLVGNLNKPKGQTTLMPPLAEINGQNSNSTIFMDDHEIGKVPGIGFKLAQKLREFVLERPPEARIPYSGPRTKEMVTVADVRNHQDIDFEKLEKLLGGPGSPHGIGYKVWCLMHGIDDSDVSQARAIPRQISIEDSYVRLNTYAELLKQLKVLSQSLLNRMRIDLLADEDDFEEHKTDSLENTSNRTNSSFMNKKWLAHPKTLRLSTRPRQPLLPDGTRPRTMKRISHSCPLPNLVFSLQEGIESLAEKLVGTTILHMFRKLHPEKSFWNLSLINLAVTNMAEAGGQSKTANGRDIGNMLRRQEDVLKDFRVTATDESASEVETSLESPAKDKVETDEENEEAWDDNDCGSETSDYCELCDSHIPAFAMLAHQRFHSPDIG